MSEIPTTYVSDLGIDNLLRRRFLTGAQIFPGIGMQAQAATAAEKSWTAVVNPKASKSLTLVTNHQVASATAGIFEFRDSSEAQITAGVYSPTEDFGMYADRAAFGALGGATPTATKFWRGATNTGGGAPFPPGTTRATGLSSFSSVIQKGEGIVLILKPEQGFVVAHQTNNADLYSRWSFVEVPISGMGDVDRAVASILALLSGARQ